MSKRSLFVAGVGLALGFPATRAPVITHYRVESKNETTVDLSGLGQPVQQNSFGLVSWIAVTVSDTTGGRSVHVVVDSMKYEGTIPLLTQSTADSAKGGTLNGWVDQNGRIKDLVAHPQNLLLSDVQGVIHGLFPKLKAGAKAGEGWSDTLEINSSANGANLKSKFTIEYTAGGTETVEGVPALRVTASSSATLSGTMENAQAGTMEVSGSVKGNSQSLLGLDGRYFGGQSNSTTDQQLKIAMAPAPIPVRTVRSVTVTWIP
jgi:hypothetical protein